MSRAEPIEVIGNRVSDGVGAGGLFGLRQDREPIARLGLRLGYASPISSARDQTLLGMRLLAAFFAEG
jgi:hypothetical protein